MKYFPMFMGVFFIFVSIQADVSEESIAKWVEKLGDNSFQVREEATAALIKIGEPALPLLRKAEESNDPEISWRAKKIIEEIVVNDIQKGKQEEVEAQNDKDNSIPFDEEFEYNGPGFHFKFKFSGKMNDIFGKDFSKLRKNFFKDDVFRHFPKDFEREMNRLEKELEQLFSDEQFPILPKKEMEDLQKQWQDVQKKILPKQDTFIDGLELAKVEEAIRIQLQLEKNQGLIVTNIAETGSLVKLGIQKWDLLLKINNTDISSVPQFSKEWQQIPKNEKVILVVIRRGNVQNIEFVK